MEETLDALESSDANSVKDTLDKLIEMESGVVPVGNINRLFKIISSSLATENVQIVELYCALLEKLIPDFGPEIETLFIPLIPKIIALQVIPELEKKALRLFELYTYKTKNLENVLKVLIPTGIHGDNWQLRVSSLNMLVLLIEIDPTFLENDSAVLKLLENVLLRLKDESEQVKQSAKATCQRIVELVETPERLIRRLSRYYQEIFTNEVGLSRAKVQITHLNDQLFGFVPSAIIRQIESREDQRDRVNGVVALERVVVNRYSFDDIRQHLPAFGRFLNRILAETNVSIVAPLLSILQHLASVLGYGIIVQFLPSLMYKLGNEKIGVRYATFRLFHGLVQELGARCLVPHLMKGLESTNWHIREETLNVFSMAMLLRQDYNFLKLSIFIARLLDDVKTKVRYTANEALAVIGIQKGYNALFDHIRDILDDTAAAQLQERIDIGTLPTLYDERIEYPKFPTPVATPLLMKRSTIDPLPNIHKGNRAGDLTQIPARRRDAEVSQSDSDFTQNLRLLKSKATLDPSPAKTVVNQFPRRKLVKPKPEAVSKSFEISRQSAPAFPKSKTKTVLTPLKKPTKPHASRGSSLVNSTDIASYANFNELTPVENPSDELQAAMIALKSKQWNKQFKAITVIRQICKHHPKLVYFELKAVTADVLALSDSLRSSLSKNALILIGEMATAFGAKKLDPMVASMLPLLLKKAADTNAFISEEASKSLALVCDNCNPVKTIPALVKSGLTGQRSAGIKAQATKHMATAFSKIPSSRDALRIKDLPQIVKQLFTAATNDGNSDVRNYSKTALCSLHAVVGEGQVETMVARDMEPKDIERLSKLLHSHPRPQPDRNPQRPARQQSNQVNTSPAKQQLTSFSSELQKSKSKSAGFNRNILSNSKDDVDLFQMATTQIQSATWQKKIELLNLTSEIIAKYGNLARQPARIKQVMTIFLRCFGDINTKVAAHALSTFTKTLPAIVESLGRYLPELVQVLSLNLASTNSGIRNAALQVFEALIESVETTQLLQPMCSALENSNARAKTSLLVILNQVVINSKPPHIYKYVLPVVFRLMDEQKMDIRTMTNQTLGQLYEIIGPTLIEMAPGDKHKRIIEVLNKM